MNGRPTGKEDKITSMQVEFNLGISSVYRISEKQS